MNRFIALVCMGLLAVQAQAATPKKAMKKPADSGYLALDKPCLLEEAGNIGPNFKGHSTIAVNEAFKGIAPKDQYESDAEYTQRIASVLDSKPEAIKSGQLCIVPEINRLTDDYDVGTQALKVRAISTYGNGWFDGKDYRRIARVAGGYRNLKRGSYTGSNAYGAEREVGTKQLDGYYVVFDKDAIVTAGHSAPLDYRETRMDLTVDVSMVGADARAQQDDIDTAILYSVVPPYTGTSNRHQSPTIDDPRDEDETQHLVVARLKAIAVFNKKTGAIIKVVTVGE